MLFLHIHKQCQNTSSIGGTVLKESKYRQTKFLRFETLQIHFLSAYNRTSLDALTLTSYCSYRRCVLIQRYFCAVYYNAGKVDLTKSCWNPKRKLRVTTHFLEIIKIIIKSSNIQINIWHFLSN